MTEQSRDAIASTDPRVQAAWKQYLAAVDRGEAIEVEAFLDGHREVADELRSLIVFDLAARRVVKNDSNREDASLKSPTLISSKSILGPAIKTSNGNERLQKPPVQKSNERAESSGSHPDHIGRYKVLKKLGSGAMGVVYLAEDISLGRQVALKTPTFEDDTDGELLKRFYREARAVASLKHVGLCGVYEVGEADGRHYISMEFVAGKKLSDCIKSEKLMTEKQAMAVVRKIALAMHEAHSHGVIHRDLKPDNIMINEKGDPVVMDFGLVHKTESKDSTKLTQHGTLIGSPAYMSKEQVEGDPDKLTAATDQYSLGVVLYQLLTSKLPFEGGLHAVLGAILTREPPPPSSHRPDLNPNLEAVCLKMMAKEAKDRFPSMKAAAEALADVARGTSTLAGNSVAARAKRNSQNNEATETTLEVMPDAGVGDADDFDFKSPLVSSPARKPQRRKKSNSPNALLIGGISAGVLLLAAIIWFQFGNTQVKVEVLAEGFDVKFNEAGITVSDGTSETKVKPGQHTLHITSIKPGANGTVEEFDTEQLTLKKGGKPVVSVSIENGAAVAKLDGKVIPRRSLTVSSTGKSNTSSSTPLKTIDLLNKVDLTQHTISGKWIRVGEVLISPKERNACVALPVENIPESYQLTVQAERVSGTNNLSLFLVFEGKEAQVVLDSDAPSGICCGLNVLELQKIDQNPSTWRGAVLPEGKAVRIVATVRRGHIEVECDGQKIIDWKGTSKALTHDRFWTASLPTGKLSLGSWESVFKISHISLEPLSTSTTPSGSAIGPETTLTKREPGVMSNDTALSSGDANRNKTTQQAREDVSNSIRVTMAGPTSLAELNTSGNDTAAWVSVDGRRIYWQQNLTSIDDSKIWQAERASPTEPFGNQKLIADGEQPTLAPDELQMVFIRRDSTHTKRLYTASRKSIEDKFEAEVELTQFGNNLIFNSPFITADGLSLFINSRLISRTSVTDGGYNVARRAKVADAWSPMTPFQIEWDAVAQKAPLTWIAMEPDELSFLATHELDIGQFRVLRFTRSRKTEPFAKYEYLSLPGMPVVYGRAPRYIAATRELFLTAPADYASSNSLAGWQTGNHNLWVIRDVTFSTTFVDPATTQKGAIRAADVPIPAIAPFSVVQARKHQEEWALYLKAPVEHENSVGIKTVLIPPGEFIMGRLPGEAARFPRSGLYQEPATTQHKVTLTRPFRMGTTEVTRRQWRDVMGSEPWRGKDKGPEGDDYPANYTTKTAAKEFCKRLSEKEGKTYRLPTEAEWEFACRAGSVTLYFFGENHSQVGEYACKAGLQVVATKKPNPWGLFDMYGNLWEWVADGRTAFTSEAAVDPLLNPSDAQSIIRGSCFRSAIPAEFSSGARHSWPGTLPTDEKGFRIVCEADR